MLFAFDLLTLDSRDFRAEPLVARRRRLQDLIAATRVPASCSAASSGDGGTSRPDKVIDEDD